MNEFEKQVWLECMARIATEAKNMEGIYNNQAKDSLKYGRSHAKSDAAYARIQAEAYRWIAEYLGGTQSPNSFWR